MVDRCGVDGLADEVDANLGPDAESGSADRARVARGKAHLVLPEIREAAAALRQLRQRVLTVGPAVGEGLEQGVLGVARCGAGCVRGRARGLRSPDTYTPSETCTRRGSTRCRKCHSPDGCSPALGRRRRSPPGARRRERRGGTSRMCRTAFSLFPWLARVAAGRPRRRRRQRREPEPQTSSSRRSGRGAPESQMGRMRRTARPLRSDSSIARADKCTCGTPRS